MAIAAYPEIAPVTAYRIERMIDGGFVVTEAPSIDNIGGSNRLLMFKFACTDIADALGYIGDRLDPVEKPAEPCK